MGTEGEPIRPSIRSCIIRQGEAAAVADGEPLVIIHTAAIQGKPRGAMLTHRNLVACSIHATAALGLTYDDAYLNILPLFHIAGLMAALTVLHAGGRNLLIAKYDPVAAGRMIDREKISFIGNFPPILTQLLDAQAAGECSLSALRHVLGVELPDTVKRFEKLGTGKFWLAYGQTETMGLTCFCLNAERPGSAGRPGPLVDLRIADEADREVEPGKPGEIQIRGPLVFAGYWGEKELTDQTLRGGWHHTGDVGRLDEEGYLFFVGRKAEKELIKPGGENVYPAEVEKVVLEHPGIREVAVIGVPDPKFGEGIKAVCVLKEGARISGQELIEFVGREDRSVQETGVRRIRRRPPQNEATGPSIGQRSRSFTAPVQRGDAGKTIFPVNPVDIFCRAGTIAARRREGDAGGRHAPTVTSRCAINNDPRPWLSPDRASDYESECRRFESSWAHQ